MTGLPTMVRLSKRDELPMNFVICDFEPRYAWRRALVGARDASGIQKQHSAAPFVSRDMRVAVEQNVDIVRSPIRRNMLQAKFQSASIQVDNERPVEVTITVSPDKGELRTNGAQFVHDALRANVAQMPDFIRVSSEFSYFFGQAIVRVRQNENAQHVLL